MPFWKLPWFVYNILICLTCDNGDLEIPGYNLEMIDYPSNSKEGGICIYYKNSLLLKALRYLLLTRMYKLWKKNLRKTVSFYFFI